MESLINFGHWKASKADTNLPAHTDAGLEFVYVANGAVQWDYEGSVVHVPAHHLSFTWPWQTHGARDTRLPAVELYWILIPLVNGKSRNKAPIISNGIGLSAAENRQLIQLLGRSLPVIAVGRRSGRHIAQLVERLQTNGNILDLKARGHLLLLLGEVQQALERSEANQDQNKERDPGLKAVRTFWEVDVGSRLENPWTLDGMAYACGLGRTAFAAKTKELYADTPIRKLARHRTEKAAALLRETRLSITEIAYRCGFVSSQHFATVFKDYCGHRPSDVRIKSKIGVSSGRSG
jgi:AraC family 4-hydroxyphenylacetate 3-monooxygenase operon regulatory protein